MPSRSMRRAIRQATPITQINVTPFVDVMLVLLIVFMVTAPLLAVGVPVDLPKSDARALVDAGDRLTLTIDAEGDIYLQETKIDKGQLIPRLFAISDNVEGHVVDQRIYVRGDFDLSYGRIMEVMGALNGAGFNRVALVTRPNR
ncbi:MAG: ExbD/TolR family protein [Parvularculales bacterium]